MSEYADAKWILRQVAELARPIARKSVSEVVAETLRIETPGGFAGPWDRNTFPYMSEPLDMTSSRNVQAVVFVGPAQCGKTFSMLGGRIAYATVHDPADQLVIHMSQDTARDWSRKELERWIAHSPAMRDKQSKRSRDDNTFDKFWRDGSVLKIGWPSIRQVASKSVRDVLVTDYDRMPLDIGGEGALFGLVVKRLQAWFSRGIAICESSPGHDVPMEHANWSRPPGSHIAPPVHGILGLYNQGDRRMWYWQCPHCREWFCAEPGLGLFGLPDSEEIISLLTSYSVGQLVPRYSEISCPQCESKIEQSHKRGMNIGGRWLVEGEQIDSRGEVRGEPLRSPWATYWLGGVSAAFQTWPSLIQKQLNAIQIWSQTGDSSLWKTTVNTDQAMPFFPLGGAKQANSAEALQQMAEDWQRETVPEQVRFLVTTVDVQGNRFMLQTFGFGPGMVVDGEHEPDWWLISREVIKKSKRTHKGTGESLEINAGAYPEDWDVLTERTGSSFTLADGSGRRMYVKIMGSDSGGKAGVTNNAYAWWRKLQIKRMDGKVRLMKGEGKPNAPRVEVRMPDQRGRTDRNSTARGDVPVLFCGSKVLKDALSGQLERCAAGDGGAHFPQGFGLEVYAEFVAEYKDADGHWQCPNGVRNEAIDLAVYAKAIAIKLGANEPAFWRNPPSWAQPHNTNSLVFAPDGPAPAPIQRRPLMRTQSSYLRR